MEPDCRDDWVETMRMAEHPLHLRWAAQQKNTINSVKPFSCEDITTTVVVYEKWTTKQRKHIQFYTPPIPTQKIRIVYSRLTMTNTAKFQRQ